MPTKRPATSLVRRWPDIAPGGKLFGHRFLNRLAIAEIQRAPNPDADEEPVDADFKDAPAPASKLGDPISEDEPPVTAADLVDDTPPWDEAEQGGVFDEPTEPLITAAQLRAVHTRLTKLGFNGKKADKDKAREFISHLVKRPLESSKDLTKSEASMLIDLEDGELARQLDDFNAERQMAAEGEA